MTMETYSGAPADEITGRTAPVGFALTTSGIDGRVTCRCPVTVRCTFALRTGVAGCVGVGVGAGVGAGVGTAGWGGAGG